MFRKLSALVVALTVVACIAGCGGGSKVGDVCDLLYSKITSACDITDPVDAAIVANGLSIAWGTPVTVADVMGSSKSDFTDECKTGYDEGLSTLTDEQKNALIDAQTDAINDITTTDCQTMMNSLGTALFL